MYVIYMYNLFLLLSLSFIEGQTCLPQGLSQKEAGRPERSLGKCSRCSVWVWGMSHSPPRLHLDSEPSTHRISQSSPWQPLAQASVVSALCC